MQGFLLSQSINSAYCFEHTFIKVTGKIKFVHEIGLVCDHLQHIKRLLVTNQESLELFLYTFKQICRTTFEISWGKVQNLLGMKLTNDVTLLFLSCCRNRCDLWLLLAQQEFFCNKPRTLLSSLYVYLSSVSNYFPNSLR